MNKPKTTRCAIYTRKSNENGLEQEFNSLDAQREACEAFIKSQAHEGWAGMTECYDDGGFSGGSLKRPGLRRLLADIAARNVDTVVVYKIDRLTRSLADFARLVELFDRFEVTFVSVTQTFNTTNSMGRLTLNVLLSFAQFEREVTGERIRDKIAASKAKGLWMGGYPPLGYDAPADTKRILQVNDNEAAIVHRIFERYLQVGSVKLLGAWLEEEGIRPKQWTARSGRKMGAGKFSRSALYHLLRNPIYRGMIRHKSAVHRGGHPPIVGSKLYKDVQIQLDRATGRPKGPRKVNLEAALVGRIFDETGRPMTPTSSRGKQKRMYRYYAARQKDLDAIRPDIQRVPGVAIEHQLRSVLQRLIPAYTGDHLELLRRVEVQASKVTALIDANLGSDVTFRLIGGESASVDLCRPDWLRLELPLRIRNRRARTNLQLTKEPETCFDQVMVNALRRAHAMIGLDDRRMPILRTSPSTFYDRRLVRLAFLAPDLQAAILEGRQPSHLSLEQLIERPVPLDWEEQRSIFQLDRARFKLRHRSEASTLAAEAACKASIDRRL